MTKHWLVYQYSALYSNLVITPRINIIYWNTFSIMKSDICDTKRVLHIIEEKAYIFLVYFCANH